MKKVIFVGQDKYLNNHKEILPQPAKNFKPSWFINMPVDDINTNEYIKKLIPNNLTAKICPSFSEIFNEGFVLPSPCDLWIRFEKDGSWAWEASLGTIKLTEHNDRQFVNHTSMNVKKIFKIEYPFYCITPKGYSVRQIPMFYHGNTEWHIAYGTIQTDKHHAINPQILITSDSNEIYIKKGEPLNYLVPYKREKFKLVFDDYNKYENQINAAEYKARLKFKNGYVK